MFADQALQALFKALTNYPIIEGAVALLILVAGYRMMGNGKKDGPSPGPSSSFSHEYPLWLLSGPIHDTMVHVASMKHETVRCRELLDDMKDQNTRLLQLLEMIQNENIINPRRLTE